MFNILLGLFAMLICAVTLALNTAGFITNYAKGDPYYKVNMVAVCVMILCIVFNAVVLIQNVIKAG
jgi:hypothetical protein